MYCHNCGNQIVEGGKFCGACGSSTIGQGPLPATMQNRLANYLLDITLGVIAFDILLLILWGLLSLISQSANGGEENAFMKIMDLLLPILMALAYPFYCLLCEATTGRTIGKLITKTKVVDRMGGKPSFLRILGRSFVRIIPFEPLSYLFGSYPIGWHDSLTGTLVVPVDMTREQVQAMKIDEIKKLKSHSTGATIAIVIAGVFMLIIIIGILASIVLASLNSARQKAIEAKAKLENTNTQAPIEIENGQQLVE